MKSISLSVDTATPKKDAFKIAQTRGEERVVVLPDKKLTPRVAPLRGQKN
jgi:hypothetical protein